MLTTIAIQTFTSTSTNVIRVVWNVNWRKLYPLLGRYSVSKSAGFWITNLPHMLSAGLLSKRVPATDWVVANMCFGARHKCSSQASSLHPCMSWKCQNISYNKQMFLNYDVSDVLSFCLSMSSFENTLKSWWQKPDWIYLIWTYRDPPPPSWIN